MLSASIPNGTRKEVYQRDGYQCAICSGTSSLQIHHYVPRGQGGNDTAHNLITLCGMCHGTVHGLWRNETHEAFSPEEMEQAICEYLADYYNADMPEWYPFK